MWRGFELDVPVGVLPPGATDTELLADWMMSERGAMRLAGGRMLEVTAGSGCLSVLAGSVGAAGVACDINPAAFSAMRSNFRRHRTDFDVADNSGGLRATTGERFDVIVANPPYLDARGDDDPTGIGSAFFGVSRLLDDLFEASSSLLTDDGVLAVTFAEWADVDAYHAVASDYGWNGRTIGERTSVRGERRYRLDEWVPAR